MAGVIAVVEAMVAAMAPGSPGGTQITLDELLHSVVDGDIRDSLRRLYEAVNTIAHGGHIDIVDMVGIVSDAVVDLITTVKAGLADGRVSVDLIVSGITNGHLKEVVRKAIDGIENIPTELSGIGVIGIIMSMQKYVGRIIDLVKKLKH